MALQLASIKEQWRLAVKPFAFETSHIKTIYMAVLPQPPPYITSCEYSPSRPHSRSPMNYTNWPIVILYYCSKAKLIIIFTFQLLHTETVPKT